VTIALATGMLWLSNHIRNDRIVSLPTAGQVLAHVFYLQGIIHCGQIVDVFWSLCIEIQFYVCLLILVALAQRLGNRRISLLCVLLPFTVVSLGIHALWIPEPGPWMFKFWYLFQLGAMAYWTSSRELRESDLFMYSSVLVALIAWHPGFSSGIGVLTGVAIYLASK
jgi:peptidoglycan/LPS O-acetylase OafA/YrhL